MEILDTILVETNKDTIKDFKIHYNYDDTVTVEFQGSYLGEWRKYQAKLKVTSIFQFLTARKMKFANKKSLHLSSNDYVTKRLLTLFGQDYNSHKKDQESTVNVGQFLTPFYREDPVFITYTRKTVGIIADLDDEENIFNDFVETSEATSFNKKEVADINQEVKIPLHQKRFYNCYGITSATLTKLIWKIVFKNLIHPMEEDLRKFMTGLGGIINRDLLAEYINNKAQWNQVHKDGNIHLLPIMILLKIYDTKVLKTKFGKGVWKALCNNSRSRNQLFVSACKRHSLLQDQETMVAFIKLNIKQKSTMLDIGVVKFPVAYVNYRWPQLRSEAIKFLVNKGTPMYFFKSDKYTLKKIIKRLEKDDIPFLRVLLIILKPHLPDQESCDVWLVFT